jgi:hypothetical protein
MADLKPARRYIATAVPTPNRRGWWAQWAAPGLVPRYVMDGDQPQTFNTPGAAEVSAMKVLFDALNSRPAGTWKGRREVMGPAELAHDLAAADVTPTDFSRIIGSRQDRVMDMLNGAREIPFFCWWLLPEMKDQEFTDRIFEIAMQHTDESVPEEQPR